MIARTGYTGEDGFEFYVPQDRTADLWDALMHAGRASGLVPVGLGARDTLRLEARMPLYGNELADDISPLEAGLGWAVKLDKGAFVGSESIGGHEGDGTAAPHRRLPADWSAPAPPGMATRFRWTARTSAWSPAAPTRRRSAPRSG